MDPKWRIELNLVFSSCIRLSVFTGSTFLFISSQWGFACPAWSTSSRLISHLSSSCHVLHRIKILNWTERVLCMIHLNCSNGLWLYIWSLKTTVSLGDETGNVPEQKEDLYQTICTAQLHTIESNHIQLLDSMISTSRPTKPLKYWTEREIGAVTTTLVEGY